MVLAMLLRRSYGRLTKKGFSARLNTILDKAIDQSAILRTVLRKLVSYGLLKKILRNGPTKIVHTAFVVVSNGFVTEV